MIFTSSPATNADNGQANPKPILNASMKPPPYQSTRHNVRFPGSMLAARELGVHRAHLHRVLTGERHSATLTDGWNAWLTRNPQFRRLQKV